MGTWIVGIIVAVVIGFAAYGAYRGRKKGCGGGCADCSSCPGAAEKNS